ncbi:MAG: AraC family transcriptional regulator [Ruminococcus sp.]|nr:AraC family transcriptional regulator [Ruminococcus sp.]
MSIYFELSMQELPLTIDTIGNHWYQQPTHRLKGFPFYHWLQTETGQGIVEIAGAKLTLNPGEGLLIAPNTPHHYHNISADWYTSFVTFGGTLANDIHKICGISSYLFVNAQDGVFFQNWIDNTIDAYTNGELDDLTLSSYCYEFLMHLSRRYVADSHKTNPLYLQYIEPIIKKIETSYADPLDVDELALEVHVTPQYLTRLFQRFTGYSVRSYITRYRINQAKEMLIDKPYHTVEQISFLCGYNDVSYFISVFKKQTGITPKQFRKMYGVRVNVH